MTDVRDDVERAFSSKQRPIVHIEDALKGTAAFGGGIVLGRYLGKAIMRARAKRNLHKTAMNELKAHQVMDNAGQASGFDRFRSQTKRRK